MEIFSRRSISRLKIYDMRAYNKIKKALFTAFVVLLVAATPLSALAAKTLVPGGGTVGIKMQSDGVMVVGIPEKMKDGETVSPASVAGIKPGDIITQIGSAEIKSGDDLKKAIKSLDGSAVSIRVIRSGEPQQMTLTPYSPEQGTYELGLWVRDCIAGIGTVTFYDPETGLYGALGHSVSDAEAGILLPLRSGVIVRSSVTGVVTGKAGSPGQLQGGFDFDEVLGTITKNTATGIYGHMEKLPAGAREPIEIALSNEITTGSAIILANVSGTEVREYAIEISRVYTGAEAVERSMMITVTDPDLLAATGGIVQGMSGSPIIQNGKLIGAVTHVLINDPQRGYGISIEKMLQTAMDTPENKAA